jgi:MFS transporter, DHA3 family, macrolide efflux protein
MATPASTLGFRQVLQTPAVKRLWMAQLISVFGDILAVFAIYSVVTFQMHGTPMQVAMVLIAFLTPLALVSPVAGVFVDRWNVKTTMIASDLIRALLVIVLAFARDLNLMYATLFAMSIVSAFFVPAQAITVRTLSPPGGLLAVNALMTQAIYGGQIIAPSISGLLVDFAGAKTCFILDAVTFLVSAGLIASLTITRDATAPATAPAHPLASLMQGLRFIVTHRAISFVMLSFACGMFAVRCFGALLSVWVRDVLVSSARTFGLLNTLIGIGMLAGSQLVRQLSRRVSPERLVSCAVAGMGGAVTLTAISAHTISAAAGTFALGVCAALIMITSQTLMQQETPQEMLGRVSSSMMSLMAVAQVLAMLVAGPVAQFAGLRNLYYGSAVMLFGVGAAGALQLRRRR